MKDGPTTQPSLLYRLRNTKDKEAWARFVQIYTPVVYRYCKRHRLRGADAADVSQDVLMAIARAMPRFNYDPSQGTFRAWLFTVVRSKLSTFASRLARQIQGTGETDVHLNLAAQPSPEEEADWDKECAQRLFDWASEEIKKESSEKTYQAFWRTAVKNQPTSEVAAALGMTVGAVYIARSRVMAQIRARIKNVSEI